MNADIANKLGGYWKEVNYLWYSVEYKYAGNPDYPKEIDRLRGEDDPHRKTKKEIVRDTEKAYAALIQALGTEWLYGSGSVEKA